MMKVDLYWNVRSKLYSVRSREPGENYGRVIARVETAVIIDPVGVVSDNGRRKVIAKQSKNVHAVIRGIWVGGVANQTDRQIENFIGGGIRWFYNPYKQTEFVQGTALGPNDDAPVSARKWRHLLADVVREGDRVTPRVIARPW